MSVFKVTLFLSTFVLLLSCAPPILAEDGVLETYAKKAIDQVGQGNVQNAMTSLRTGINSYAYKPAKPSDELLKATQTAIDQEKDDKKKAALLVIQSVLWLVLPEKANQAEGLLDQAEKLDDKLPEVFNTRAILRIRRGANEKALADLNKAIELNPTYLDAIHNRAGLYAAMHDPDNAVKDSIRYQELIGEINYKANQRWPQDWSKSLGQTLTLEGKAINAKLGALLMEDGNSIWIDGLDAWPDGFYQGDDKGKRLRVTGEVIRRDDLPVFVPKPGEEAKAGIPVKSEEDLEKAKWRFLLKSAKWTEVE